MFNRPLLYHYPYSLSSGIARLALVEKGVRWRSRFVDIGRRHENYAPWYVRLNARAVVPSLEHRGVVITDAINIALYINNHFPGPELFPARQQERELMEELVTLQQQYPETELSYCVLDEKKRRRALRDFDARRKVLTELAKKHEALEATYASKFDEIDRLSSRMEDPDYKQEIVNRLHRILDVLDQAASRDVFLCGPEYSLADVVWTAFLARMEYLGLGKMWQDGRRPNLDTYYTNMKARKSFKKAQLSTSKSRRFSLMLFVHNHRILTAILVALAVAGLAAALIASGLLSGPPAAA